MAQTTTALSWKDADLFYSTNGSSWTEFSGFASQVSIGGGDRQSGSKFTFDGDTAIITRGKREPIEVTVSVVYTEGASDIFEIVRAAYENGTDLYVRWLPKGNTTGNFQFSTSAGIAKSVPYPVGEAGSGDPAGIEFTVMVASVTKAAAA